MNDIDNEILESLPEAVTHELASLRKHWWCVALLGMTLVLCGVGAILFPILSTVGIAIALGAVLLVSGIVTIVGAFWTSKWSAFLLQLIVGILYCILGLAMAEAPMVTAAALTMLVAAFAIAAGTIRIVAALALRFPQWGWVLANGLIVLVFGVIIFRHFPEASLLLLGILLGVDLIFAGITWLFLALDLRSLPSEI